MIGHEINEIVLKHVPAQDVTPIQWGGEGGGGGRRRGGLHMHGSNKVAPGTVAAHQYSEQPRFSMPPSARKNYASHQARAFKAERKKKFSSDVNTFARVLQAQL